MAECGSRPTGCDGMALSDRAAWLARCLGSSPASPLTAEDVDAVLAVATHRTVGPGDVLFGRHDAVEHVFILERGTVALARPRTDRTHLLQILRAGDVFGDVGLFLGRTAPVEAMALDEAEVLCLPGPELLRLVTTHPRLAVRWMVSMAARLADTQDRLEELLAGPLDHQLAVLIGHSTDEHGRVLATQEMLARLLGARRPSVARSLANLEKQGLIRRHYGRIEVLDPAGLVALTT